MIWFNYTLIVAVLAPRAGDPANRPAGRLPNHYTLIVAVLAPRPGDPANRPAGRLPNHYTLIPSETQARRRDLRGDAAD